jgi:hypothetical protein
MQEESKLYRATMASSTFTDLGAHRREVIEAILRFGFPVASLSLTERAIAPAN